MHCVAEDPMAGIDAGAIAGLGKNLGVKAATSLEAVLDQFDVLIDFTAPAATMSNIELCRTHGKKL